MTNIQRQSRNMLALLIPILLLAMLMRLIGIESQSLWIDEGFTWNLTQYGDWFTILRQDVHPPLYFIMIDRWVEFVGTSVFAMRFFSVLPGVLSVAVVYRLAHEMNRQRSEMFSWVPIIAALLLAVAEAEIFLAHEIRSYTWHVLWASLSMWGFLRWSRLAKQAQASRLWLILWMFTTIALIYTFYLGAFIGVVQGLYALLFLRGRQRLFAIGVLVLCALSLLPWLTLTGSDQSENISRAEWIRPDAFAFWLDDFRTKYFTRLWLLTIPLAVIGLFVMRYRRVRLHPTGILLLLWFGVPLLLTLALNEQVPTYQPRRVSQIVPAIALLMAFGLGNLQSRVRWILLMVLVIYGMVSVDFWRFKQPWREMATETAPLIAPNTPMLIELGGDDYAPRYHYAEALPNSYDFLLDSGEPAPDANILIGLTTWRDLQPDVYQGSLPAIIDSQDHWWFFYWSSDRGALNWLETFGFERSATVSVEFNPDVFLYRYDRLPENPVMSYPNGLTLRDVVIHDNLYIELLWSSENTLTTDYITSAFLLDDNNQIVAEYASQPFFDQHPTSTWQPETVIYDPKPLESNQPIAAGTYTVGVAVYEFLGAERVFRQPITGEDYVRVGSVTLQVELISDND